MELRTNEIGNLEIIRKNPTELLETHSKRENATQGDLDDLYIHRLMNRQQVGTHLKLKSQGKEN